MEIDSVDILITDYCNQNCGFCFARKEMKSALKKEMSVSDFRFLIHKLRQHEIAHIFILGGEPTIRSQFIPMMKYALKYFFRISLLSNGLFSKQIQNFLISVAPRISIQFNITTPGFVYNPQIRKNIINNIAQLAPKTDVVLAINSTFQTDKDAKHIINLIDKKILSQVEVCLCFTKPIAGEKNVISIDDYPKAGKNIVKFIDYLEKLGPPKLIHSISGFTPCMFTAQESKLLAEKKIKFRYHCHTGFNDSWFTIAPNLSVFRCFPLSTMERFQITKKTNLVQLRKKFDSILNHYEQTIILDKCKTCPFYGLEKNQCSGPCLAFRINALHLFKKLGINK